MRHQKKGTTSFGRILGKKKALLNNLVKALLQNERIETTLARAKETGRLSEKLITYGKKGTVHARRQAYKILKNRDLVKKLFDEIAPKYKNRNGGYTRVIKTGFRIGDAAPTAIIEFVEEEISEKKKKKSKTDKPKTSKKLAVEKKKQEKPKAKAEKKEEVKVEVENEPETEEKIETPETVEPEIEEKQEDLEESKEEVEEALNEGVAEAPAEKAEEKKEEPESKKETESAKEGKPEESVIKEKS
ncbi:MAG TPA: 50S ribosomal protein L17 [Candidatus Cloacimonetes bacterium]|nr:50S ribosomal protein L17 [Candidatus Cloacimonadota bacterium]